MIDETLAKLDAFYASSALPQRERDDLRLRVLADHFASRPDHAADSAAGLDARLRDTLSRASPQRIASVAHKLAAHPQASTELLARMVSIGGPAATHALRNGARLDRAVLTQAAERGTTEQALAVAKRADLDAGLAETLFRRTEHNVLLALVANTSVALDRVTAKWLVLRARHEDALARAIIARRPPGCDLTPLFLVADAEHRAAMILAARRHDIGRTPDYRGIVTTDRPIDLATTRRDRAAFAHALAHQLGVSLNDAMRLLEDDGGEALALALNVVHVTPEMARTILSWLRAGNAGDGHIERLMRLACELGASAARRMIGAMFARPVETTADTSRPDRMRPWTVRRPDTSRIDRRAAVIGAAKPLFKA